MDQLHHKNRIKSDIPVYLAILVINLGIVAIAQCNLKIWGIVLMLILAVVETGIVLKYFMHLDPKKKIVHVLLVFTLIFFASVLFWPVWDIAFSPRTLSEYSTGE